MLAPKTWPIPPKDAKAGTEAILSHCGVEPSSKGTWKEVTRYGKTKLFIRNPETLFFYEELREKKLPDVTNVIQKCYRGYLDRLYDARMRASRLIQRRWKGYFARKTFKKIVAIVRIQTAIRCQKSHRLYTSTKAALLIQKIARGWLKHKMWKQERLRRKREKNSKQIQRWYKLVMCRRVIKKLKATWANAKADTPPKVPAYGKAYAWPKFPCHFKYAQPIFQKLQFKWWWKSMCKFLTKEQTVVVRQKVATSDIFKGKKAWSIARKFTGDYLSSSSNPTAEAFKRALAAPPLGNPKIVFATMAVKVNPAGKPQPRAIMMTDQGIYKLDPQAYKVKKVITPYANIVGVHLSPHKDNFIVIFCSPPYRDMLLDIDGSPDGSPEKERVSEMTILLKERCKDLKVTFGDSCKYNNKRKEGNPGVDVNLSFKTDAQVLKPTYMKEGNAGAVKYPSSFN